MKQRKMGKADLTEVTKMFQLFEAGFSPAQAASMLDWSSEGIRAYYKCFRAVKAGEPIRINSKAYCESAVKAFCEAHGFEYKHASKMEATKPEETEQLPGQMSVDDIAVTDGPEPISEQMMTPGRNEPEELLQLRQDMSRAIGRFVWRIIDEYMKRAGIVRDGK